MKIRQLVLLISTLSLLALSAGCELIVDFDRNKIDAAMDTDTGVAGTGGGNDGGNDSGMDAGEDAGNDAGEDASMDAMMVMPDSGMDANMPDADDDDSGL